VTNRDRIMRVQSVLTAGVLVAAIAVLVSGGAPEGNATGLAPAPAQSTAPPEGFDATPAVIPLDQAQPQARTHHKPPKQGATVTTAPPTVSLPAADLTSATAGIPRRVLVAFVSATPPASSSGRRWPPSASLSPTTR
jgi:hypothetical protein